ncbi:MAG: Efflux ABC transporter, permease protein, partial [uncultured Blastococcus sp.]
DRRRAAQDVPPSPDLGDHRRPQRPAGARRRPAGAHRAGAAAGGGAAVPLRRPDQRRAVPAGRAGHRAAAVPAHRRGGRGGRLDRRRGPGRHIALPARPPGGPHPAAGGQAGRRPGIRAGHRAGGGRRRLRHRQHPVRGPARRRDLGVGYLADVGRARRPFRAGDRLRGGVDARRRGVRAVLLHVHRLAVGRDDGRSGGAGGVVAAVHPRRRVPDRALPAHPVLAGVRRLLPRSDRLARHHPGAGAAGRLRRCAAGGRLGELHDQGRHQL